MSYVFNDMEKSEIFNAANSCKGMTLNSEGVEYIALELAGASCAPCTKSYSTLLVKKFLTLQLPIKRLERC